MAVTDESLRRRIGTNPLARFGYRAMIVARTPGALREKPRESLHYLFRSREVSNHTYELANVHEMVVALAKPLGADPGRVSGYVAELREDHELRDALAARLRTNSRRDDDPRYGKRTMDYCIVRARRPAVAVELGIHDGLGSAVMLRALQRNAAEGADGRLLSFDMSEEAGWLVPDDLRERLSVHLGDVRQILEPALREHGVDYLNSDIGPKYPDKEWVFDAACRHARGELMIRDEVDEGSALPRAAERHGGRYDTFRERPEGHFAPGHLIGIASFPRAHAAR